jgi:hypothetical protein
MSAHPRKSLAILAALPAILVLSLGLGSCLGGSGGASTAGGAFGLTVCSLGCGGTSFAVSTWQANKDIVFTFNQDVDPTSVNFSSISLTSTSDGSSPLGSFLVNGTRVTFRPALLETSGGLTFGFTDGFTYRVEIPADGPNVVKSLNGRLNSNFISGTITIQGIADLVPGPPTILSYDPSPENPPTASIFPITIVFGDILRTSQLADPETGASALVTVAVADADTGSSSQIPGLFSTSVDRNLLTTTLVFTPLVGYPSGEGGRRQLQVNLSQQIVDLVGNPLSGAGILVIPLLEGSSTSGVITETFTDHAKEDPSGSVTGLWAATAGALDSGQDPVTGNHRGGSSGVLGTLSLEDMILRYDTEAETLFSDFLGESVAITGGVFPFEEIHVDSDSVLSASGSLPLRLIARGDMVFEGVLDVSGEDAPPNYGKGVPTTERNLPEGTTFSFSEADEPRNSIAGGGDPGIGAVGGGSGGRGGMSWYAGDDGMGFEFGSNQYYLDTGNCGWAGIEDGSCPTETPGRFRDTFRGNDYCGTNGDRVGGIPAEGAPVGAGPAGKIDEDLDGGSGMGSWAWPPKSNVMPDQQLNGGVRVKSHLYVDNGVPISRENHARHRARGAGGGGYWTAGERGDYFVPGSVNPLGTAIGVTTQPIVDNALSIREYNADGLGSDWLTWDASAGANSRPVFDAEGGNYVKPLGMESLSPEGNFLLGGSGGGGAGNNQHGSWNETPSLANGDIDTFRCGDGAGGGAGGGAAQLFAGNRLTVTGEILAQGGDGGDSSFMLSLPYSFPEEINFGTPGDGGGGGGSGGAVLLQSMGTFTGGTGAVIVEGGAGGLGSAGNPGGAGGSGVVRVDSAVPLTLAQLQDLVEPDEAVDLTPIGQPGLPNSGTASFNWGGLDTGDITGSDGTIFNGNSSGVRSFWYEAPPEVNQIVITRWEIECEYQDAGGVHSLIYASDGAITDPGTTPVWIALQVAWMAPGESEEAEPTIILSTDWIIPGFRIVTDGLAQLGLVLSRAVRYTLVFDQDVINGLMGGAANGYFRVKEINFEWEGG